MLRINRLKGRPLAQAGSVTSDPQRMPLAFDWSRVPRHFEPELLISMMADFQALGPIGFRGPAAAIVPDHLTVADGAIRTVQHISPGVRCRSNALVREVLDITGEDLLFITSANSSSAPAGRGAHYEMDAIAGEFGHRRDVVLIGHDDEAAIRAQLPASPALLDVDRRLPPRRARGRPAGAGARAARLARHRRRARGRRPPRLRPRVAPSAHVRVPVRWPTSWSACAA